MGNQLALENQICQTRELWISDANYYQNENVLHSAFWQVPSPGECLCLLILIILQS